ncbi:MAG: phosphatidate cytidylyltransferase [gamma proteobacterium symbiont of Bathyaustriella thionipta]|nr:phosphatidate cytidylyltransferase [gamma proteobacterium symbiont of Bathyaustriella thionipta]
MLKQRILTAVILAPLFLLALFYLPSPEFALLMAAVILIAGLEWAALSGIKAITGRIWLLVMLSALMAALWKWPLIQPAIVWLLLVISFGWMALFVVLLGWQKPITPFKGVSYPAAASALLILPAAWIAMLLLHKSSPLLLLYVLSLIWVADIAAYFSGRAFGRNKLAALVSPGKTREGLWGALLAVAVYSLICGFLFRYTDKALIVFVALSLLSATVSVAGDLFESLLKRRAGKKDSGRILPGHGGILDRIDSATAALPFFVSGAWFSGLLS